MEVAEEAFRKAADLDSDTAKSYLIMGDFYNQTGRSEKAMEVYQKALTEQPDDIVMAHAVALQYFRMQNIDEAEEETEKILQRNPKYLPAKILSAEIKIFRKKYQSAIEILSKIIEQEPGSEIAHFLIGRAYNGIGDANIAETYFQKAIDLNPNFARAKTQLAEMHYRNEDFRLAEKEAREVLSQYPGNTQAQHLLGRAMMGQDKLAEAEIVFKKALEKNPEDAVSYYRLGMIDEKRKRLNSAVSNYEKSLGLFPRGFDTLASLAFLYNSTGETEKAVAILEHKLEEFKDNDQALAVLYFIKGDLLVAQGNVSDAIRSYENAIEKKSRTFQSLLFAGGSSGVRRPKTGGNFKVRGNCQKGSKAVRCPYDARHYSRVREDDSTWLKNIIEKPSK